MLKRILRRLRPHRSPAAVPAPVASTAERPPAPSIQERAKALKVLDDDALMLMLVEQISLAVAGVHELQRRRPDLPIFEALATLQRVVPGLMRDLEKRIGKPQEIH
jgi:hypothetical protein